MLEQAVDLPAQVRAHRKTETMLGTLTSLIDDVGHVELYDDAKRFQATCQGAESTFAGDHAPDTISKVLSRVRNDQLPAVRTMQDQLRISHDVALAKVMPEVIQPVLATGRSIPFGVEMITQAEVAIRALEDRTSDSLRNHKDAAQRGAEEIDELDRKLQVMVSFHGWLGRRERVAADLGRAIATYGRAVLDEQRALAQLTFIKSVLRVLKALRFELDAAVVSLRTEADLYHQVWRADELIGKDAGPRDTVMLVPADVQPEVEESTIIQQAFSALQASFASLDMEKFIADFYARWAAGGRGPFDLGSENADSATRAKASLLTELDG